MVTKYLQLYPLRSYFPGFEFTIVYLFVQLAQLHPILFQQFLWRPF